MDGELQGAENFEQDINDIRQKYEIFLMSKDKNDLEKARAMENSLNEIKATYNLRSEKSKMNSKLVRSSTARVIMDDIKTGKIIDQMESLLSQCYILYGDIPKIEWKLTVGKNIENGGKVFNATTVSCARTDQVMKPNTSIYQIKWLVGKTDAPDTSTLGLCNELFDVKTTSRWLEFDNYIGWCVGNERSSRVSNGVMAGYVKPDQNKNQFQNACKYIGNESLPPLKSGDIVTLIYDSVERTLSFKLKEKKIDGQIVNLPKQPLYWFAGKFGQDFKVTIIK